MPGVYLTQLLARTERGTGASPGAAAHKSAQGTWAPAESYESCAYYESGFGCNDEDDDDDDGDDDDEDEDDDDEADWSFSPPRAVDTSLRLASSTAA
jgi:hypothetical protein